MVEINYGRIYIQLTSKSIMYTDRENNMAADNMSHYPMQFDPELNYFVPHENATMDLFRPDYIQQMNGEGYTDYDLFREHYIELQELQHSGDYYNRFALEVIKPWFRNLDPYDLSISDSNDIEHDLSIMRKFIRKLRNRRRYTKAFLRNFMTSDYYRSHQTNLERLGDIDSQINYVINMLNDYLNKEQLKKSMKTRRRKLLNGFRARNAMQGMGRYLSKKNMHPGSHVMKIVTDSLVDPLDRHELYMSPRKAANYMETHAHNPNPRLPVGGAKKNAKTHKRGKRGNTGKHNKRRTMRR